MGNCIGTTETPICDLCSSELDTPYIYCLYCNKRYHKQCIITCKLTHKGCPHCKHDYMRYIDKINK